MVFCFFKWTMLAKAQFQFRAVKITRMLFKVCFFFLLGILMVFDFAEKKEIDRETPLMCHVGICHTRWATHGPPSQNNSHPHRSDENNGLY